MTNKCVYCEKEFMREKSLDIHMCEQKRRHVRKHDKDSIIGLRAYDKFWRFSRDPNKVSKFEDFVKSPYYNAFVKFGQYLIDVRCFDIDKCIEWVLRSAIKIDKWPTDTVYNQFLNEYLLKETVDGALFRTFSTSINWANGRDIAPEDMLLYGNENVLCHYVNNGLISPWVLYQSYSGNQFMQRLDKNINIIIDVINPDMWGARFDNNPEDVEYAKNILKEAGW